MKKIIIIALSLLFILSYGVTDNSSDNIIKVRGSTSFASILYLGHQKGIGGSYYTPIKISSLDYTHIGDPTNNYHSINDPGRTIGTGVFGTFGFEGKLFTSLEIITPFFSNIHPFFNNNNITINFDLEICPISIIGGIEVDIQPLPFLIFSSGIKIGTGWSTPIANGLARNNYTKLIPNKPYEILVNDDSFYGPVLQSWFNTTLQFDFSALLPNNIKRWTHIVFKITPEFKYKALLNGNPNVPFMWESDDGENFNGWYFNSIFILGYRLPIIIDKRKINAEKKTFKGFIQHNNFEILLGMLTEIDDLNLTVYNLSKMNNKGWGSDFCYVIFGPFINFELPNDFSIMLLFQWKNERQYTSKTVGNANFLLREYEDWYIHFYRVGLIFGWGF